ncbi:peptide-methionine (S)-S-oxide reductase [Flindersiella endophytica]
MRTIREKIKMFRSKLSMPSAEQALAGRASRPFSIGTVHATLGTPLEGPVPEGLEVAVFGLGCFWGAERAFWQTSGVWSTAVGYAGGHTPNPTYEEVCTGQTGHTEAVRVVFDPSKVTYEQLLKVFWESHDPTQGYRQGNDIGTQYRSAIYTTSATQAEAATQSKATYGATLKEAGYGEISTEIAPLGEFYYAEDYHQQYLARRVHGYSCETSTGVPYPG